MNKIITGLFILCLINVLATAQPKMELTKSQFDFGQINEEKGKAGHEFAFTNTGDSPLKIQTVKATCGCTTPGWTRQEILPNETGFIKVEYNPAGRPGPFSKAVTITTNEAQPIHVIHISGKVIPKPKTPQEDFPYQVGRLRASSKYLNMDGISTKEPVIRGFALYNDSKDTIYFQKEFEGPKYIGVDFNPMALPPFQKGEVILTFDAKAKNDLGYGSDNIVLHTQGEDSLASKEFQVMSTVSEYFPPMTQAELAEAPRLVFTKTSHDFGDISAEELVTVEFSLRNGGKSDLNIRKTKANCGCTVSKPDRDTLKAGEQTSLVVSFNPKGRTGRQKKTVTVFSNDPQQPTQQVEINAYIK